MTIVQDNPCPNCGKPNDRVSSLGRGQFDLPIGPTPGDLTICIGCGAVLKFTDTLSLVKVSQDELETIGRNTELRRTVDLVRVEIARQRARRQ